MTPILSALLSLGLCLDQRMWAQADLPPRPFLRADTGPLVSLGRRVTLRCRGSRGAEMYVLEKGQESGRMVIQDMKPSGIEGEFPIPSVTAQDAGIYSCRYNHSSGWSQPSHPLKLVVIGLHDAPSLSALPSSQVHLGQNVILQCQAEGWYGSAALYKDGKQIQQSNTKQSLWRYQTNFSIPAMTPAHRGIYQCYTFHWHAPQEWSVPSDPLVLRITVPGTTKDPPLTQSPGDHQALTSSLPRTVFPLPDPAPQNYTVGNLVRLSLAGLVLIILGVLLAEACLHQRGP
ncbi:platelet glycoprotein VI-like [Macrotis lagotis]|uniref:platelet glycoprotein VI-like n=1 Tax=Macrotis lagotis TaxID=92651 RepID=UPI003D69AAC5